MKRIRIILCLLLFCILPVGAQNKNVSFDVASLVGYTTWQNVPFWLGSNQFGSIPLDNASLSLIGAIHKYYNPASRRIIDWGVSLEG